MSDSNSTSSSTITNSSLINILIKNVLVLTEQTTIGINACNSPHNSEHCPYHVSANGVSKIIVATLPGIASVLIFNLGTAKECITSSEVIANEIFEFIGISNI